MKTKEAVPFDPEKERDELFSQSRRLINGIRQANNSKQRLSVIKLALTAFDHHDTAAHDDTILAGAADVLYLAIWELVSGSNDLGYAENFRVEQVKGICHIMSLTLRCSDRVALQCFHHLGSELIPILFAVGGIDELQESCWPLCAMILSRFHMLGPSIEETLGSPKLLLFLVRVIRQHRNACQNGKIAVHQALHLMLAFSRCTESKYQIITFPGLLDVLVDVAKSKCKSGDASVMLCHDILQSLSAEAKSRTPFMKHPQALAAVLHGCRSQETVLPSLHCLRLLSVDKPNKVVLCRPSFQVFEIVNGVLGKRTITDEERLLSLYVIRNLVSSTTAKRIASQHELIQRLLEAATDDKVHPADVVAGQAFKRLSTFVEPKDKNHGLLIEALVAMASSNNPNVLMWASRGILMQSLMMGGSFMIVRDSNVMEALVSLADSEYSKVHVPALQTIANLSQEGANGRILSNNVPILNILVRTISNPEEMTEVSVKESVRAILGLINNRTSMNRIAKHLGVVASLSHFGTSSSTDLGMRKAALHGVVALAPMI